MTPTPEERALYIGDRLFKLSKDEQDRHIYSGEFKCITEEEGNIIFEDNIFEYQPFIKWLSTPDGLNSLEEKMIERRYNIIIAYEPLRGWHCVFAKDHLYNLIRKGRYDRSTWEWDKLKYEAILNAAYKALKGEEDGK